MPQFAYRAKSGPQKVVDGLIEAASADEALEKLDAMGLLPTRLDEVAAGEAANLKAADRAPAPDHREAAAPPQKTRKPLLGGIRSQEITIFGRQLATLLKSGVPILRAMQIITDQTENPRLRKVFDHIQREIRDGNPLSSVLASYPKLFPPIYIAMVRTGEDSGTLQETLLRISEYRQGQEAIYSRVRTAMAYPILMALVGVGTVAFMLTFVIPRLSGLFSTMGGSLPLPTRILMAVSGVFQKKLFWAAAAGAVLLAVTVLRTRPVQVKAFWSRLSLRLPVIKTFTIKVELARFSRTLDLLIRSGIPILKAIEITTPVLSNTVLRAHFARTREEVAGGGSFGKSLKQTGAFPAFMTNLLMVGEESGHLDEALGEIALFYERETDEAIKVMTSLLEPLMILVMGLIVGFIVIAMLLPMFELNMMVK
ncbi:MAG TPA: type II secretion system F family protein [Candidatus Eisenbacteria bacterium]|nr:type II secretion system F family protein [Candidatus Eisenbacteria bacterium]